MSLLFAATYPKRTTALVSLGLVARLLWAPDYPWGMRDDQQRALHEFSWAFTSLARKPSDWHARSADSRTRKPGSSPTTSDAAEARQLSMSSWQCSAIST